MNEQIRIDEDECYPFFHLVDEYGEAAEVPSETLARWGEVLDAFEDVQGEMRDVFNGAKERNARQVALAKAEKAAADAQAKLDALRNETA